MAYQEGAGLLEYQGLPVGWLNTEERAEAGRLLAGRELAAMEALNPALGTLKKRFRLELEGVEF